MEGKAKQLRNDLIEMVYKAQTGHIGGSFSMIETLVALYFDEMNYDINDIKKADRDRFVLSKGHAAPGLYVVLAEAGFYSKELLYNTFRCLDSNFQGHPDMKKTPGVEMTTGSLGIGLSAANGMALGGRMQGLDFKVYCMMGDGEINEGQIWEAAAAAAHYKLDNVIGFVDLNGLQNDGKTIDVKNMESLSEKWSAFGWEVQEINGHDFTQIFSAIDKAKNTTGKPSMILLRTVKGKGVSLFENAPEWHGKVLGDEDYRIASEEL